MFYIFHSFMCFFFILSFVIFFFSNLCYYIDIKLENVNVMTYDIYELPIYFLYQIIEEKNNIQLQYSLNSTEKLNLQIYTIWPNNFYIQLRSMYTSTLIPNKSNMNFTFELVNINIWYLLEFQNKKDKENFVKCNHRF